MAGPAPRPRFSLAFHDHVVVRDADGWWFEELWTPERGPVLAARVALWRSRPAGTGPGGDPGAGVCATILVDDGQPVALDARLARLTASLHTVYGGGLPAGLRTDPSAREEPIAFSRLRDATEIQITSSIGGARPARVRPR